jgi:hypothetical protein
MDHGKQVGEVGLESGSSPTWSRVKRDKEYSVTRVRADAALANSPRYKHSGLS